MKEDLDLLMDQCVMSYKKLEEKGGQSCVIKTSPFVIENVDLGIRIEYSYNKQNYKNKQQAIRLMEMAILSIIK